MAETPAKKGIPAWVWIGCGCLLFPLAIVVAVGGFGFFAVNYGKGVIDKMADPEKRTAAAIEALGAKSLPEGWHVRTYFGLFGFNMVALGDGTPPPPPAGDTFEEKARSVENLDLGNLADNQRIFFYMKLDKNNENTIEEILNGKSRGGNGMNLDLGVRFNDARELSRGDLQVAGQRVAFVGKAGTLETKHGANERVVYSELSFDCPDQIRRLAIFFERQAGEGQLKGARPDGYPPAEAAPDAAAAFAGTPADPGTLQPFLDHFAVCG